MKTVYSIKATFEIAVDPSKPATLAAAAAWIAKLQAGEVVSKPDGAEFKVTCGEPKIVNRRDADA